MRQSPTSKVEVSNNKALLKTCGRRSTYYCDEVRYGRSPSQQQQESGRLTTAPRSN